MTPKIAATLEIFSGSADRYCPNGYREPLRMQERLAALSKIKAIKAIEVAQSDVTQELPGKELKRMLKDYGLACSGVSANLAYDRRFALAAFGHQHPKTRNAAIDEGRKAVDLARQLTATEITLRLYSDGFDYPFHIDYAAHWNTLISSIKTIAKYASPDVNVAIAYKATEPRKFLTVSSVGKALSLCQEIAMKNVGVALDFSHALMGARTREAMLFYHGRTSCCNSISATAPSSDDMLVYGQCSYVGNNGALFYLKVSKYKGYLTLDMQPKRIDPAQACQIAAGNVAILWKKLEKIDTTELRKAQKTLDAVESQKIIRRAMLQ